MGKSESKETASCQLEEALQCSEDMVCIMQLKYVTIYYIVRVYNNAIAYM